MEQFHLLIAQPVATADRSLLGCSGLAFRYAAVRCVKVPK